MQKVFLNVLTGLIIVYMPVQSVAQNPVISNGKVQNSRIEYKNEGLSYMPDASREQQVRNTMEKATAFIRSISTKGGYVAVYSEDQKKRYGEGFYELALPTEIFTQYPGTPAMGETFLRAYKATGDEEYLSAAYEAGKALAWGQRAEGGWDHLVDVSHFYAHSKNIARKSGNCTFDDNITQGVLSYLMDLDQFIDESWLTETIELGLKFMQTSQAANGAWPQWYPSIGSYHDYWTFNDDALSNSIRVMMKAHSQYKKPEYLESVKRAGDFVIMSQIEAPQAGWAQQYDHNLNPGWARRFEPPGVCSSVTGSTIKLLADIYLYTKDEKYLNPIPAAIKWLEDSKLEDNLWARIYELKTNKPIYGQHDRIVHYRASEGRTDYNFLGSFNINDRIAYSNNVLKLKGKYKEKEPLSPTERSAKIDNMMKPVQKAIALLNDKGYWLDRETGMINLEDYVTNMNILCEHLELTKQINN